MQYPKQYLYRRIVKAKLYMDAHYADKIDLKCLMRQCYFSEFHFIRLFKKTYALTPHQYLMRKRINQAKEKLKTSEKSIQEIAFDSGFKSLSSFSHLFKKFTLKSPDQYRKEFLYRRQIGISQPYTQIPGCYQLNNERRMFK